MGEQYRLSQQYTFFEEAVNVIQEAIDMTDANAPTRPLYLNVLGNHFHQRYLDTSDLTDLELAIETYSQAVNLSSSQNPFSTAMLWQYCANSLSDFPLTSVCGTWSSFNVGL